MLRCFLIVLLAVLVCGCASRWEHSTKRSSEFYADDRDCQVQTGSATQAIEPGQDRMSYESCMWDKGWHKKRSVWFFDPTGH